MNDKQGEDWHMMTGNRGLRCLWGLIIIVGGIVIAGIVFYLIWQNAMRQVAGYG